MLSQETRLCSEKTGIIAVMTLSPQIHPNNLVYVFSNLSSLLDEIEGETSIFLYINGTKGVTIEQLKMYAIH